MGQFKWSGEGLGGADWAEQLEGSPASLRTRHAPLAWAEMGSQASGVPPGMGKVQVSITDFQSWQGLVTWLRLFLQHHLD